MHPNLDIERRASHCKILGLKAINLVDLHISYYGHLIIYWISIVGSRMYVNQLDLWPLNQESYNFLQVSGNIMQYRRTI